LYSLSTAATPWQCSTEHSILFIGSPVIISLMRNVPVYSVIVGSGVLEDWTCVMVFGRIVCLTASRRPQNPKEPTSLPL
jgi:hypothetical protein